MHPRLARLAIVVVAAMVIVGGIVVVWSWVEFLRERTGPSAPHGSELPSAANDAEALLVPPESDRLRALSAADAGTPVATPGPARLSGTVRLREDGALLPGLVVEATASGPDGRNILATTTDADGRFAFEWPSAVTARFVRVRAGRMTSALWKNLERRVSSDHPVAVDLEVSRGSSLSGIVLDEDGYAIPRIDVLAWCDASFLPDRPADRTTTTAIDGSFRLDHLGDAFHVVARAPGRVCSRGLRGELAPGVDASGLELVIEPAVTLRGVVVDATGRPVEGVALSVDASAESSASDATAVPGVRTFHGMRVSTRSNAQGRFELGQLAERPWNVRVESERCVLADVAVDPTEEARIVVDPGFDLTGRVLAHDGTPAAGADVAVHGGEASLRRTKTDAHGRFEVRALSGTANGWVGVVASGNALCVRQPIAITSDVSDFVEIRLEPPLPLAGRVVDGAGLPVRDALVRIEGERLVVLDALFGESPTVEWALGENERYTDAEGRFRFPSLYSGRFEVRATLSDAPQLFESVKALAGHEHLELVLDRTRLGRVVFRGRVADKFTSEPVRDFTVTPMLLNATGAHGRDVPVSDADGTFRIEGYPKGTYELHIRSPGYARWTSGEHDLSEGERSFDALLKPSRSVVLGLHWMRDRPEQRYATVEFRNEWGRVLPVETGGGSSTSMVTLGERRITVSGIPAGRVSIRATVRGFEPMTQELDLTRPTDEAVVFAFDWEDPARVRETKDYAVVVLWVDDVAAFEADPKAIGTWIRERRAGYVDHRVDLVFLDADEQELAQASVEPAEAGGFRFEIRRAYAGIVSRDGLVLPEVVAGLTAPPASVRVSSAGFATRTVTLPAELRTDLVFPVALQRAR